MCPILNPEKFNLEIRRLRRENDFLECRSTGKWAILGQNSGVGFVMASHGYSGYVKCEVKTRILDQRLRIWLSATARFRDFENCSLTSEQKSIIIKNRGYNYPSPTNMKKQIYRAQAIPAPA